MAGQRAFAGGLLPAARAECQHVLGPVAGLPVVARTRRACVDPRPAGDGEAFGAARALRHIAIGKKNWLFTGSERAGKRAAVIQSLLGTAKLNGLDPAAWLKDTLEKLPAWPNSRLDELLPLRRDQKED